MNTGILHLENVSFQKNGKSLLKDLSVEIQPGEVILLSGASGSGKTTLLRLICRLDEATHGLISFQNQPIQHYLPHEYRKAVAMVFQTPLFFEGSVLENLQRVDRLHRRLRPSEVFYEDCLKQVSLTPDMLKQNALSLSVGEKQRLSIARSLLNQPQVLLLDEPISALDADSAVSLLQSLKMLNQTQQITIVMVTHQQPPIPFETRALRLMDGQLVEEALP